MAKEYKCDNCGKLADDTGKIYIKTFGYSLYFSFSSASPADLCPECAKAATDALTDMRKNNKHRIEEL